MAFAKGHGLTAVLSYLELFFKDVRAVAV